MSGEKLFTLDPLAERERFIDSIYQSALSERPAYADMPREDVRGTIDRCLREIEDLEAVASSNKALAALTPDVARNITAIWDFSGSGNYDEPRGEDPYKNLDWAEWSDRNRLNYSAWLSRKMAQMLDPDAATDSAKDAIRAYGPTIIYNANDTMNDVARDVLKRPDTMVPEEKAVVFEKGIKNTLEQIRGFVLPENLHQPGKEIALVSHAPHLVRVAHFLKESNPLPADMRIRMFPMKPPGTPRDREEYITMEIRGILYYVYIAKVANKETCEYIVHGKNQQKAEPHL